MELTKRERRKLKLGKLRQQSQEAQTEHEHRVEQQKQFAEHKAKSTKSKYYIIGGIIALSVIAVISYSVYSAARSGPYDDFAKCLSEKGAVMYGAMEWCHFTQGQRAMFGNSFKYINYHEFTELPGIKKTPTWVIGGKWYENAQSFDKLASLTGCKV